jgi:hypothetical protein
MEFENRYRDFSIDNYRNLCQKLEQSENGEASLFSLVLYLRPSFLLKNKEEWEKGYEILLKHIRSVGIANIIRRTAIRYLGMLFKYTETIEIGSKVEDVVQRDVMIEHDLYDKGIETLQEVGNSSNRFISYDCTKVLHQEGMVEYFYK